MGGFHHYPSSEESESKAEQHEERTQYGRCGHFGQYEEAGRIDSHHVHRVNLFCDAHAAYFRRYVRSHLSGQDERHHGGTELEDKAFPHHVAYVHLVNDGILQIGCGLDDEHTSYEYGDDSDQEYGRNDELVRLRYELSPEYAPFFRLPEYHFQEKDIAPYAD